MIVKANLHDAQKDVIRRRKRFNVVRCGRRWGKSHLAFLLAFEAMIKTKGARVLYTAPTYEDLVKRYEEAKQLFAKFGSVAKEGEIQLGESVLEFRGILRYDGIRGNKYHRFIGDEWAHSPYAEKAWQLAIRPTLADFKGDAYLFSTPKGANHFKELAESKGTEGQSFQFPTSSNPHIAGTEIEAAKSELPSIVFAQEFLAEFVDFTGARIKREWLKYTDDKQFKSFGLGVDFAISTKETADYTAIVVVGRREDGTSVIVDAHRLRGSLQTIMQEVKRYADKWNVQRIYAESVQAQAWAVQELLRTKDLNVKAITPNRDKLTRFQYAESRFEQGQIELARGLDQTFEKELLAFTGTSSDSNDDYIDALVYALQASQTSKSQIRNLWN